MPHQWVMACACCGRNMEGGALLWQPSSAIQRSALLAVQRDCPTQRRGSMLWMAKQGAPGAGADADNTHAALDAAHMQDVLTRLLGDKQREGDVMTFIPNDLSRAVMGSNNSLLSALGTCSVHFTQMDINYDAPFKEGDRPYLEHILQSAACGSDEEAIFTRRAVRQLRDACASR